MKFPRYFYWIVILFIVFGIALGVVAPEFSQNLKWIADLFIDVLKRIIPFVIFSTVVQVFLQNHSAQRLGQVGIKALIYFEVISTLALAIGLGVGNLVRPGDGFKVSSDTGPADLSRFISQGKAWSWRDLLSHLWPRNIWDPFLGHGDLLQVFVLALIGGLLLKPWVVRWPRLAPGFQKFSEFLFKVVAWVMWAAPLAAGSAMASSVGKYGTRSLAPMLELLLCFYGACLLFVLGVLGFILQRVGLNIFKLLSYIKTELLTVLATSSSESGLAPLMNKLENLGCEPLIVRFVVPTGYSFNLDGTNIYLTLSILFLCQVQHIELSLQQQLFVLLVGMLTSKGAAGVTGSGFVTLAATLSAVPNLPVGSLALLLGIDRFMSECRALTNIIGNAVATLVISAWEQSLDFKKAKGMIA